MTAKHKGGLVVVLGVGFLLTLPFILLSTPEEKQHLTQSSKQIRMFEHEVGLVGIDKQSHADIEQVILEKAILTPTLKKQNIWVEHVLPEIMKFDPSEHEAISIAKWAWVYAGQQGLDPALVLALITIESRFDPFATSVVGAQGLMQIMPFWKKELGNPDDNLFDVETNIRYGTSILKQYLKRYHTIEKALAAYNGSKGRVKYPNKVLSHIKRYTL